MLLILLVCSTHTKYANFLYVFIPAPASTRMRPRQHQPGPQTYRPTQNHRPKNVRDVHFGTGVRECNKGDVSSRTTPSPQEYDPESLRKGLMASKPGAPSFQFGRASHASPNTSRETPSPQAYDPESLRRGLMATKSHMSSVKFGSPPRRKKSQTASPSPQEYNSEMLRKGMCSLSNKRRAAGVKFGTGPRTCNGADEREKRSIPGPCSYSTVSSSVLSKYPTSRSSSFGAR